MSEPPGVAKPNWWIFKEIARRMGHEWASDSARELWDNEISVLAPQLAGIKYSRLEGDGLQWPVPDRTTAARPLLHKDGCFTCGLGRFVPADWTPPAEVPDDRLSLCPEHGTPALSLSHPHPDRAGNRSERAS